MEKLFTADTYANMKRVGEPFEKSGKLYTRVECKCLKCGGKGYVPFFVDGGVCYDCGGSGIESHEVRLYTEKEKASMDRAAEVRKEKKNSQAVDRWLRMNGFDKDGNVYIAVGNSYPLKDELKQAGYLYNQTLGWHGAQELEIDAEDCHLEKMHFDQLAKVIMDSTGHRYVNWLDDAADKVKALQPKKEVTESKSEFMGEVKERLRNLSAVIKNIRGFDGMYGYSYVYTFEVGDNILTWFSAKDLEMEVGTKVDLTGTVKKFDEYRGVKQTVLSRCVVKAV